MSFRIYLDEMVDPQLAVLLRQDGFDVLTTQEAELASKKTPDADQLTFATQQGRAILTHDIKDFPVLAREWETARRPHSGIIISTQRPLRVLRAGIVRLQEMYPEGIPNVTLACR